MRYRRPSIFSGSGAVKTVYLYGWTVENGGWDSPTIILRRGETVRLVIRSMDIAHGFTIPELGVDTGVIKPGYEVVVELSFDEVGEYIFYCSVYCSPLHYKMVGKIVVVAG